MARGDKSKYTDKQERSGSMSHAERSRAAEQGLATRRREGNA